MPRVEQSNLAGQACATIRRRPLVIEIANGRGGVRNAWYSVCPRKAWVPATSASVVSVPMIIQQQHVGFRQPFQGVGFSDHDSLLIAKGESLQTFKWEGHARARRVVGSDDGDAVGA